MFNYDLNIKLHIVNSIIVNISYCDYIVPMNSIPDVATFNLIMSVAGIGDYFNGSRFSAVLVIVLGWL